MIDTDWWSRGSLIPFTIIKIKVVSVHIVSLRDATESGRKASTLNGVKKVLY